MPVNSCTLCGFRQERQRELQLGSGCAFTTMHDFVVTMMLYVLYICYSIASVLVIVSAFQIYIKMNTGEDGIVKSFLSLLGACLFIIGASIVLPAFSVIAYKAV